ncbi:hypothetical protein EBR03_05975, partial [bacterium]|nr:hypothetical protein [bacterium]
LAFLSLNLFMMVDQAGLRLKVDVKAALFSVSFAFLQIFLSPINWSVKIFKLTLQFLQEVYQSGQ